jgi:serine/threonine-protein kinase
VVPDLLAIDDRVADRYVVRGILGHGAMGAVYEVESADGTRHAMKSALPDLQDGGEAVRRLAREGNALQLLAHDNIVAAIDQVVERGRLFLVLELARGRSLTALMTGTQLAPRRALVLTRQMLDAVAHAHAHGVVHRDLKPDNVIVTVAGPAENPFERVKLLDFGLVKLLDDAAALLGGSKMTRTGVAFGTPAYIAPESAMGRPIDGRADLYSIAVMLFEMLTGRLPFVESDPGKLLRAHVSTPPPRLADVAPGAGFCTPAMEALVAGALAKKPDDRFANAAAMRACLDDAFLSVS